MSLRVRTKPAFVFFSYAATIETTTTKVQAASGAVALVVARSATTPKTWLRSTPNNTETGDASHGAPCRDNPNCILSFLVQLYIFLPDECSSGSLLFISLFFREGVVISLYVPSTNMPLADHSVVIQPHLTKVPEIYCFLQAGGIVAAAEVCCAGCAPLCCGRCARRFSFACCWLFPSCFVVMAVIFHRPHDFLPDATAAVTGCSSPCTS